MAEYLPDFESVDDFVGCPDLFDPEYKGEPLLQFDKRTRMLTEGGVGVGYIILLRQFN